MKLISMWQPFASLAVLGVKSIETRGWTVSYRGPLAIHATLAWNKECRKLASQDVCWEPLRKYFGIGGLNAITPSSRVEALRYRLPFGCIIGTVDLVDYVRMEYCLDCDGCGWYEGGKTIKTKCRKCHGTGAIVSGDNPTETEYALGNYQVGRYALILENAHAFAEPIPFKGKQAKLLDLPADVEALVRFQMEEDKSK